MKWILIVFVFHTDTQLFVPEEAGHFATESLCYEAAVDYPNSVCYGPDSKKIEVWHRDK